MSQKNLSKNFSISLEQLTALAGETVAKALELGAHEVSVNLNEAIGLSVSVRGGNPEQAEYSHDKALTIALSVNHQNGSAGTSDLSKNAILETINAALNFAKYTSADEFSALPEKKYLADVSKFHELDLFYPWELSMPEATAQCCKYEEYALKQDPRIIQSEGFQLSTSISQGVFANSLGLNFGLTSSYHNISGTLIGSAGEGMQRDGWYEESRKPLNEVQWQSVADIAVERTLRRLKPQRIPTGKMPVIFEANLASSIISLLVGAVSGSALYRKSTFLLDSLGTKVLPEFINIYEDPFVKQGFASKNCDGEGVAVSARKWIDKGVLQGYFLSSYSARKLNMQSTGNAGGAHNLLVSDNMFSGSTQELINKMGRGLLVTETMGHGVNMITGDYSVGAVGFWVEGGEIKYPVEEITIAGNLKSMFAGIGGVSSDQLTRSGITCGAILIDEMTIAGQ